MKKIIRQFCFSALLVSAFAPAQAQFARMDDAVKYRQAAFQLLSTHVGRTGAMAKGEVAFDKATLEANMAIIELISKQVWHAFPAGSDTALSKAKAEVWKDPVNFKTSADKMQVEIGNLSQVVKSGDRASLKTAFGALTQTCKSCHDNYRNR